MVIRIIPLEAMSQDQVLDLDEMVLMLVCKLVRTVTVNKGSYRNMDLAMQLKVLLIHPMEMVHMEEEEMLQGELLVGVAACRFKTYPMRTEHLPSSDWQRRWVVMAGTEEATVP
jgi:hypothetical protein